jgi:hypothetical protein
MKILLNILIVSLTLVTSLTACASIDTQINKSSFSAMWASNYNSINELYSDTEVGLVAIGTISNVIGVFPLTTAEKENQPILSFTDFAFKIEASLKGSTNKEIIIRQTGSYSSGQLVDDPIFKLDEQYILFLHEFEPGKYFVKGGPQGRYKIINDKIYSMNYLLSEKVYQAPQGLDIEGINKHVFIETFRSENK